MAWQEVAQQVVKEAAPAVIGAGAGLLNQVFFGYKNWKRTQEVNRQQYEYNKDLAERAFRQNVQMWNAENAYNTPAAQMMRMRAAGLNPNLIYGNGQEASAGIAGDAPNLQYGDYNPKVSYFDPSGVSEGINAALSLKQINSLVDLQKSQADLNDTNAIKSAEETKYVGSLADAKTTESMSRAFYNNAMTGNTYALTDQIRKNIERTDVELGILRYELGNLPIKIALANQMSAAQIAEIEERTKNYAPERDKILAGIQTEIATMVRLYSAAALDDQSVENAKETLEGIRETNRKLKAEAGISEAEYELIEKYGWAKYFNLVAGGIRSIF